MARLSADEFNAMLQPVEVQGARLMERHARQTEGRQNLWRYGLLLMLGVLVAESVAGRMR